VVVVGTAEEAVHFTGVDTKLEDIILLPVMKEKLAVRTAVREALAVQVIRTTFMVALVVRTTIRLASTVDNLPEQIAMSLQLEVIIEQP